MSREMSLTMQISTEPAEPKFRRLWLVRCRRSWMVRLGIGLGVFIFLLKGRSRHAGWHNLYRHIPISTIYTQATCYTCPANGGNDCLPIYTDRASRLPGAVPLVMGLTCRIESRNNSLPPGLLLSAFHLLLQMARRCWFSYSASISRFPEPCS